MKKSLLFNRILSGVLALAMTLQMMPGITLTAFAEEEEPAAVQVSEAPAVPDTPAPAPVQPEVPAAPAVPEVQPAPVEQEVTPAPSENVQGNEENAAAEGTVQEPVNPALPEEEVEESADFEEQLEEDGLLSLAEEEKNYTVLVNGSPADGREIRYGEEMRVSLSGYSGSAPVIFYLLAEDSEDEWVTLANNGAKCALALKKYYIGYVINSDEEYIDHTTKDFSVTVVKGKLPVPAGLYWDGSTMNWGLVTAMDSGAVGSYALQMYKNGTPLEVIAPIGNTVQSYANITNKITSGNEGVTYGAGKYSFAIKAVVADAWSDYYDSSEFSAPCGGYTAPLVRLEAGRGVSKVSAQQNLPFLMVPGKATNNSLIIKASADTANGYVFRTWEGSGLNFDDAESAETTVRIPDNYDGDAEITIIAYGRDNTEPNIDFFGKHPETAGALLGTASDDGDGLAEYAFSTAATAAEVAEWQPAGGQNSFTWSVSATGRYYFHVKDGSGNAAVSKTAMEATKITYHHNDGTGETRTGFQIGSEHQAISAPVRNGWTFTGWFDNADCAGAPVTAVAYTGEDAVLYAGWEKVDFVLPEVEGVEKIYDGETVSLHVDMPEGSTYTYQWYILDAETGAYTALEGETAAAYSVRNVAQSGTYQVEVTLDYGGGETETKAVDGISVKISPKELQISADNQTVTFGQDAPAYTYTVKEADLAGEDTAAVVRPGSISCAYAKNDPVLEDGYPITLNGFEADNYIIVPVDGKLTVLPRGAVTAVFAEEEPVYIFQPDTERRPAVIVTSGDTVLSPVGEDGRGDYTLVYQNNVHAGTAKAIITPKNNYSGAPIELTFRIEKASFETGVTMNGWIYGEEARNPSIGSIPSGISEYTYLYAAADSEEFTAEKPKNAGEYQVKAVFAETDDYNACETDAEPFVISKREITITARSEEFPYTGMPHSNAGFDQEGTFAPKEGFNWVKVTGTVTDVNEKDADGNPIPVANVITYALTSVTNPDNYIIHAENGELIVTAQKLPCPSNLRWDSGNPGTAVWTRVSKKDLTAQYKVTVYAEKEGEDPRQVIQATVSANSFDAAEVIRSFAEENGIGYTYSFSVQTLPGNGAAVKNYLESDPSENCGALQVGKVTITQDANVTEVRVIDGDSTEDILLLQGETIHVLVKYKEGFVSGEPGYTSGVDFRWESVKEPDYDSRFSVTMLAPLPEGDMVTVSSDDDYPSVTVFNGANTANYKSVILNAHLHDGEALAGYMISGTPEDMSSLSPEDSRWISVSGKDKNITYTVSEEGTYYLYVKDIAGNIATMHVTRYDEEGNPILFTKAINVYAVTLDPGEGTGTSQKLLKVENTAITLPAVAEIPFTYTGYSFRQWQGAATGIYVNSGSYNKNLSDTLTATWTDDHFDYTVAYYYMDTEGKYPDAPDITKTFNAVYGTKVTSQDSAIQLPKTGFTLAEDSNVIEVTSEGKTLKVHYSRNQYDLTLSWKNPDGTDHKPVTEKYYYGAELKDETAFAKPTADGYDFVGWFFGDSGAQPSEMPAHAVTATGYFRKQPTTWHIRYYKQNLVSGKPVNSYTLEDSLSQDLVAEHGDPVTMAAAQAPEIDGYAYSGAVASFGAAYGAEAPAELAAELSASANAGADGELYISVYYTRRQYQITLNVWKDSADAPREIIYSADADDVETWNVYYGADFPEGVEVYNQKLWDADLEDKDKYTLLDYVGWSTGIQPTIMPAGDVTVTRLFALKSTGKYQVEIWTENEDGTYSRHAFTYYDTVGKTVSVGKGADYTINYSDYTSSIDYFTYYQLLETPSAELIAAHGEAVSSGAVTDTDKNSEMLTLRLYFERKVMESTITYHYSKEGDAGSTVIATVVKQAKWGTKYNYEPLALFGSKVLWVQESSNKPGSFNVRNVSITGDDGKSKGPEAFDFCANGYVVSYTSYYIKEYDNPRWPTMRFESEDSLKGNYENYMGYSGTKVDVYYTRPNPDYQYYVDVYHNTNALNKENVKKPVVCTVDGTTYPVRLANEAYFYEGALYVADTSYGDYANYPGLAYYNLKETATTGRYVYTKSDENLKAGYTRMPIGDKECYLGEDGYLYISVPDNRLYAGHQTSYGFDSTNPGYAETIDGDENSFLVSYKREHADDPYAQGARVYNTSFGTTIVYNGRNGELTVSYITGPIAYLKYNFYGNICDRHAYAKGSTVPAEQVNCSHTAICKPRQGYEIVWYADPDFQTPADSDIELENSVTVYGRYENILVENYRYAYFELADPADAGGRSYKYITENDLEAFAGDSGLESTTAENVTVWRYAGQTVMVKETEMIPSFSSFAMEQTHFDSYAGSDLYYDDSNSGNNLNDYCQVSGTTLRAYYARYRFFVTVDPGYEEESTVTTEYRTQQAVTVETPTRDGYTFDGWTWMKKADEADTDFTEWTGEGVPADGKSGDAVFAMPAFSVKAVANWEAAENTQKIYHYYQNSDRTYAASAIAAAVGEGADVTVSFNGKQLAAKQFGEVIALTESGGIRYFYKAALTEGVYVIEPENLAAFVEEVTLMQDAETKVSAHLHNADHYVFSKTVREYKGSISTLDQSDTFLNQYGMTLEYYYALESGIPVNTSAFTLTGESAADVVTMLGAGDHVYGEQVTVSAAVSAGYTFVGWYRASDVLSGGSLISPDELAGKKPLNEDGSLSFSHKVTAAADFVAVVETDAVAEATVTLGGIQSLTYGYAASPTNVVTATVTLPDNASSANYVASYQWYLNGEAVPGATASSFLIPEGYDAGTYVFTCKVTVARSDNGQEKVFESSEPWTVTVGKAAMTVSAYAYTDYYDCDYHSIEVSVSNPVESQKYEIYYSLAPLDEDNYTSGTKLSDLLNEDGTLNEERAAASGVYFRNVQVNAAGETVSVPVYYYVHSLDANYSDCVSTEAKPCVQTVRILPVPVQIIAGTDTYSKIYDGSRKVTGSDFTELVKGSKNIYSILGTLPQDPQRETYIISCEALFNDYHVATASSLTLTDLMLADKNTNEIVYNYTFGENDSIVLSGYIERMPLEVLWGPEDLSFVYNGEQQAPTAALKTALPEVDEGHIEISSTGSARTVGTYSAAAKITSTDSSTQINDFALPNGSVSFAIVPRELILVPQQEEAVIYDGQAHTLETISLADGCSLGTGDTISNLVPDQSYVNAGKHPVKADADKVQILDENGANVKDNYLLKCETEYLDILPREITVTGIGAENKPYDGNTDTEAIVDPAKIVFDNLVEGDQGKLALNPDAVTAAFVDAKAGTEKPVVVTITDTESVPALLGEAAANYTLNIAGSQNSTTADIHALVITVTAEDQSTVYGEAAAFSFTYSGFLTGEDESIITGRDKVTARIRQGAGEAVPYKPGTDAGSYAIVPDLTELSAENYSFEPAEGTLVVTRRPIGVQAISGKSIDKTYDGTTDVKETPTLNVIYEFVPVEGDPKSGLFGTDDLDISFNCAYDHKDVPGDNHVDMTGIALTGSKKDNYVLQNDSFEAPGTISKAPLVIKAKDIPDFVYGASEKPTYSVSYDKFVGGETEAVLSGTLQFVCVYDPADTGNRNVSGYDIVPSGLESENYEISFEMGKLTVQKKEICVYAQADPNSVRYGADSLPVFTYTHDDLAYGESWEDPDIISGSVTSYIHSLQTAQDGEKTVVVTVPGAYKVKPSGDLSAHNYTFKYIECEVTVSKNTLTIGGIQVKDRVYDGTKDVHGDDIDFSQLTLQGSLNVDAQKLNTIGRNNWIKSLSGTYDTADAGDGKQVILQNFVLDPYISDRYELTADTQETTANILKRPVLITAGENTILYSEAAPAQTEFTATYGKFENRADSGLVSGETAGNTHVTYTCEDYFAPDEDGIYSVVKDYVIMPGSFTGSETAKLSNYEPHYAPGTLHVIPNQFDKPTVSWDSDTPGVVVWTEVGAKGNVSVSHYDLQLCKNGSPVGSAVTVTKDVTNYAFTDLIRETGAGAYTVKVTARSVDENNTDPVNVKASEPGVTDQLYAAKVSFVYNTDAKTAAGKDQIAIAGESSYVMLAGESAALTAKLKNATGYVVKSIVSDSAEMKVTGAQLNTPIQNITAEAASETLSKADDITITLTLDTVKPAIQVTVTPKPAAETFGYSADAAPRFTAEVTHTDTQSDGGYTYTYTWELKEGVPSAQQAVHTGSDASDQWSFPTGKKANPYSNGAVNENYYLVRCFVTATRADNGESVTSAKSWKIADPFVSNVIISRANFTAEVSLADWTYGEARSTVVLHTSVDIYPETDPLWNPAVKKVVYSYAERGEETTAPTQESAWSSAMPTDAGTYWIRAYIPESENYNIFTAYNKFEIFQTQLATPENLRVTHENTSYAVINWDPVDGYKENAGAEGDSKSEAKVKHYLVKLYDAEAAADAAPIATYTTSATSQDISDKIQLGGKYRFTVQAISSDDEKNCRNSEIAESEIINVNATISASNGSGEAAITDTSAQMMYNRSPIVLKAECSFGTVTGYQWYKGTTLLTGANSDTWSVVNVNSALTDGSGDYTCVLTLADGNAVITPKYTVTITKRDITLTSADETFDYDGAVKRGTPELITVGGSGYASYDGETECFTYTMTGNLTEAGEYLLKNTFDVSDGAKDGIITRLDNYSIQRIFKKIVIRVRPITEDGFTVETVDPVVYKGSAYTPKPTVTDDGLNKVLEEGKDYTYSYENNIDAGTATITISGIGNYSGSKTVTFTIQQRPITIIGSSDTKVYTGSEITIDGIADYGNLVTGHTAAITHCASGTVVNTGAEHGYVGTFTHEAQYISDADGNDVTDNYDITLKPGELWIKDFEGQITVTTTGENVVYDGNVHGASVEVTGLPASGYTVETKTSNAASVDVTPEGGITADCDELVIRNAQGVDVTEKLNIKKVPGKLIVKPREITLTSDDLTKAYDGTALTGAPTDVKVTSGSFASYTRAGEEIKESFVYTMTGSRTDVGGKDAGENTFTVAAGANTKLTNYKITKVSGDLVVTARAIAGNITIAKPDAETYDGTEHKPTPTVTDTGLETVLVEGVDFTYSYSTNVDAGEDTAVVTVTGKGNYSGTATQTFTILPREIELTSADLTKVYDGKALTGEPENVEVTSGGFASYTRDGKEIKESFVYTMTGSRTDVGGKDEGENTFTVAAGANTKLTNYKITTVSGDLVVTPRAIEDNISIVKPAAVTYDGTPKEPKPTVTATVPNATLVEGVDFTYSYSTNVDAGVDTAVVTVTGIGNYSGTATQTFTILPREIELTSDDLTKAYDGTALTGAPTDVKVTSGSFASYTRDGEEITESFVYTMTGSRTDVGGTDKEENTFTVAAGANTKLTNYKITKVSGDLVVTARAIAGNITIAKPDAETYDGTEHKPTPTVTDTGLETVLVEGVDFTYSYSTNVDAGVDTAVVTVTGIGNYSGMATQTFTIQPREIELTSDDLTKVYDGTALTGAPTDVNVTSGSFASYTRDGAEIKESFVYTMTGSRTDVGGKDAGENTFTVAAGANTKLTNYKITKVPGDLVVTPRAIENNISIVKPAAVTYDGTPKEPKPTVTAAVPNATLVEGVDFTYSYSTNVDAGEDTAVVTVTGIGNYSGTATQTFTILPREITLTSDDLTKAYDGTALTGAPTDVNVTSGSFASYTRDGAEIKESFVYTMTGSRTDVGGKDAGENTFTVAAGANTKLTNYKITKVPGDLVVTARAIAGNITIAKPEAETYDGTEHKPTPTVTDTGLDTVLVEGVDFTYSYSTNVDAGVDTAVVTVTGMGNYSGTATQTFTIQPREIELTSDDLTKVYDGTALTGAPTDVKVTSGSFAVYTKNGEKITESFAYTMTGSRTDVGGKDKEENTFTVAAGANTKLTNYKITTVSGDLVVTPRAIEDNISIVKPAAVTYDGTPKEPKPTVTATVPNATLVEGVDFTYSYSTNVDAGEDTAVITVTGIGNYSGTATQTFTILPREIELTSDDLTKAYDGTALTGAPTDVNVTSGSFASYTRDGEEIKESFVYTMTGSRTDVGGKDAGENTFTVAAGANTKLSNYTITSVYGDLIVTPVVLAITITANSDSKVYDGTPLTNDGFTFTPGVLASTDELIAVVEGTVTTVGEAANRVTSYRVMRGEVDATANYTFSQSINGKLTVTERTAALKWDYDSFIYNGEPHSVSAEITNVVTRDDKLDDVSVQSYSGDSGKINVGDYRTNADALDGADAANYKLENAEHPWKILPRNLADSTQPNGYALGITVDDLPNRIFSGNAYRPEVTVKDDLTKAGGTKHVTLVKDQDYTVTYTNNRNAGTATVTITGIGNYTGTITKTFRISPLPVKLVWSEGVFTYDGKEHRVTARVINAAGNDVVTVGTYSRNSAVDAGTYIATALTLTGADARNYTLEGGENLSYQWTIRPADITIRADDKESVLGEPLKELTYSIVAGELYNKDKLGTIKLSTDAGDKVGQYPITISITSPNPNYNITVEEGTYTITEPSVVETVPPTEETTDPNDPDKTVNTDADGIVCLWHWLIVLTDIIYAAVLILTMFRKERDESYTPEEEKKDAKRSVRRRLLGEALLLVILIVLNILGFCWIELPLSIISMILISVLTWAAYMHKFPEHEAEAAQV